MKKNIIIILISFIIAVTFDLFVRSKLLFEKVFDCDWLGCIPYAGGLYFIVVIIIPIIFLRISFSLAEESKNPYKQAVISFILSLVTILYTLFMLNTLTKAL